MKKEDLTRTVCYSVDFCGSEADQVDKYLLVAIQENSKVKLINEKGSAKAEKTKGSEILVIKTGYHIVMTISQERYERLLSGEVIKVEMRSGVTKYLAKSAESLASLSSQILELKGVKLYNYTH
jgi:hypothetical protein